jgi:hypothetical protein
MSASFKQISSMAKSWEEHFHFARAAATHKIQYLGNEAGLPTLADIAAIQVGKQASRTGVESGR